MSNREIYRLIPDTYKELIRVQIYPKHKVSIAETIRVLFKVLLNEPLTERDIYVLNILVETLVEKYGDNNLKLLCQIVTQSEEKVRTRCQ